MWDAAGEGPGGDGGDPEGGNPDAGAEATGPDLSWVPQSYHSEDGSPDLARVGEDFTNLLSEAAQREEAKALLPENGEYAFAVPEDIDFGDLELPEGFKFEVDVESEAMQPIFGEFGELLQSLNAPADVSGKLMGLLAKYEAQQYADRLKEIRADHEKLGGNEAMREARINKVVRTLESKLSKEQVEALQPALLSYEGVRAIESLARATGPGPTVPHQSGEDLAKIPPAERLKILNQRNSERA